MTYMNLNQFFVDHYDNGFPLGDFIIISNDNVQIKIIKEFLRSKSFYFEGFFNFPSNENVTQVTIEYSSNIINYALLSLLDVYNSLDSFTRMTL